MNENIKLEDKEDILNEEEVKEEFLEDEEGHRINWW